MSSRPARRPRITRPRWARPRLARTRRLSARGRLPWPPRQAVIPLLLCCFALLPLFSCGRSQPPNVLLITVDTLRPDRLGYAGHTRPTSPTLDRLAAEGVVFTRAYSQSGWTLPSLATILTGRYPKDHQATDFHHALNRSLPTLAGLLKERGYDTRGYVSHALLTARYGLNRGFWRYDASVLDRGDPHKIATSRELTELAVRDMHDLKEPFFVWIHHFDPHFAYLRHEPWASFGDRDIDRYDQEIAHTDAHIGRLLDFFRQRGVFDRTVIVFTSDHGEEFGEHGGDLHATCYDEVLHVPLIIRGPRIAPRVETTPAEQIDLLPTILARVGVEPPPECAGRDLLAAQAPRIPIMVERDRPPGFRQRCVLQYPHKLIRVEPQDTLLIPVESRAAYSEVRNVIPGTYLYNLESDPREKVNLYRPGEAQGELLLAQLAAHFTGQLDLPPERVVVSEELRERLRALGYIR